MRTCTAIMPPLPLTPTLREEYSTRLTPAEAAHSGSSELRNATACVTSMARRRGAAAPGASPRHQQDTRSARGQRSTAATHLRRPSSAPLCGRVAPKALAHRYLWLSRHIRAQWREQRCEHEDVGR